MWVLSFKGAMMIIIHVFFSICSMVLTLLGLGMIEDQSNIVAFLGLLITLIGLASVGVFVSLVNHELKKGA